MSDIDKFMLSIPVNWRYRWCENNVCGCMGGVNCSGNIQRNGFSKAEWQEWVGRNPEIKSPHDNNDDWVDHLRKLTTTTDK